MSRRRRGTLLRGGALILLMAVGGMLGNLSTGWGEPLYSSTTTLLVGDLSAGTALSKQDLKTSSQATARYAELIRSEAVLAPVRDMISGSGPWQELKDRVHVELGVNGLPLLYVTVYASTPASAQALGGAVAQEVVRLGLKGAAAPAGKASDIAAEEATALEEAIERAETRISRLEAEANAARSGRTLALLQARINDEADLIIEWQESYVAALSSVPGSPQSVQILMASSTNSTRLGPDVRLRTVLGAALGALVGLLTVFSRSRPTEARHHPRRSRSGKKPATHGDPTTRARRRKRDPWARESLSELRSEPHRADERAERRG